MGVLKHVNGPRAMRDCDWRKTWSSRKENDSFTEKEKKPKRSLDEGLGFRV